MNYPLTIFTAGFCSGIALESAARIPFWGVYGLAGAGIVGAMLALRHYRIFILLSLGLAVALGMLAFQNASVLSASHIARYASRYPKDNCCIQGYIADEPQRDGDAVTFRLRTEAVEMQGRARRCCGDVLVTVRSRETFSYAQRLLVRGSLREPRRGFGRKRQSYRDYLVNRGIRCVMKVKGPADYLIAPGRTGFPLKMMALRLRAAGERAISRHLPPVPAAIMTAMVLGEKHGIPRAITDVMMKTGTIHILVVSGFNVGLVAYCITIALKIARIPRRLQFFITAPLLILYCLATGSSNPVARATIMSIVMLAGYQLRRDGDNLNALSVAALVILSGQPSQLFDIGFQLSFASVVAIVWAFPHLRAACRFDGIPIPAARLLADNVLISLCAWAATAGFIAYYFGLICPITVWANLAVVPLASVITLSGFVLFIAAVVYPPVAPAIATTCEALIAVLVGLNQFLVSIPGAYFRI